MKLERELAVLDLETTGTWVEKDRIIEIGIVKCEPDGRRSHYVRRVNPGLPIPPAVSRITGIGDADVAEAPRFGEIAAEVLAFIGQADLAGFNLERFDLPLLERECFEAGLRFDWRSRTVFDCQKIYHFHEKRDLKAAYKYYCQKELVNAHSALGDTEATLDILAAQADRYADGSIGPLARVGSDPPADFYDAERKFRWWNGELYPVFGKYGRKTSLRQIAERDPKYLEWLASTDFGEPVKRMLRDAARGILPEPPERVRPPSAGS